MIRKRALLYVVLVLAVPLPALALERGQGAASLDVQASLGGCGVADAGISCRIDIAFSPIPDAEYYTASVTAPDGSVLELGTIASGGGGGASTSASVPFSGNGEYMVTVSAWGYDERGRPAVVESERADTDRGSRGDRAGEVEAAEPQDETVPPADRPAPTGEPPTPPGIEKPECPEASQPEYSDQSGSEPTGVPEPEPKPKPKPEPGETTDPRCDPPPQEPVPPPVP
jgi:hypothetical protein